MFFESEKRQLWFFDSKDRVKQVLFLRLNKALAMLSAIIEQIAIASQKKREKELDFVK